jgi:IS5 family transposase
MYFARELNGISRASSTKNDEGQRDPEMHQTKKGEQWFFGMKDLGRFRLSGSTEPGSPRRRPMAHRRAAQRHRQDAGGQHEQAFAEAGALQGQRARTSRSVVPSDHAPVRIGEGEVPVLAKNTAHVLTRFALYNLWMTLVKLIPMTAVVRPKAA